MRVCVVHYACMFSVFREDAIGAHDTTNASHYEKSLCSDNGYVIGNYLLGLGCATTQVIKSLYNLLTAKNLSLISGLTLIKRATKLSATRLNSLCSSSFFLGCEINKKWKA